MQGKDPTIEIMEVVGVGASQDDVKDVGIGELRKRLLEQEAHV